MTSTSVLQGIGQGLRAGLSLPPIMVFSAMLGFGSLARSQELSLGYSLLSAGGIYGMPGQVAMLEIYATGSSLLVILTGVAMANMRFLPMTIALMPTFKKSDPFYRWRYVFMHLMSINSWTFMLQKTDHVPASIRCSFFAAFGFMCFTGGLLGTAVGWFAADSLSREVMLTLIFLNPAYFIFLFCTNRQQAIVISIVLGALLGPLLYTVSPDWGLPACGLIAGSAGFLLTRRKHVPG